MVDRIPFREDPHSIETSEREANLALEQKLHAALTHCIEMSEYEADLSLEQRLPEASEREAAQSLEQRLQMPLARCSEQQRNAPQDFANGRDDFASRT